MRKAAMNPMGLPTYSAAKNASLPEDLAIAPTSQADDKRVVSDSNDPYEPVRNVGADGSPTASLHLLNPASPLSPLNPANPVNLANPLNSANGENGYRPVRPDGSGTPPPFDLRAKMPSGTRGLEMGDPGIALGAPPKVAEMPSWLTNIIEGPTPIGFLSRGLDAIGGLVFSRAVDSTSGTSDVSGPGNRPDLFEPYGNIKNIPSEYKNDRRFESLASDPDRGNRITETGIREGMSAIEAENQKLIAQGVVRGPANKNFDIYDGSGIPFDIKTPPSTEYFNPYQPAKSILSALDRTRPNGLTGNPENVRVLLDTTYLTPVDYQSLKQVLKESGNQNLRNIIEVKIKVK